MHVFQNAKGPRLTAGDQNGDQTGGRPKYEFVVHSVRKPEDDADTPDLVLRRSPIDAPAPPAREEITVIVRGALARPTAKPATPPATPPEAPPTRPGVDWVADYVASLSDSVTDDIARVVDTILAEEEAQGPAPAPASSDGSPFDGSPFDEPPVLPRPTADPREASTPPPRPPSHSRYTKRVEFDRS